MTGQHSHNQPKPNTWSNSNLKDELTGFSKTPGKTIRSYVPDKKHLMGIRLSEQTVKMTSDNDQEVPGYGQEKNKTSLIQFLTAALTRENCNFLSASWTRKRESQSEKKRDSNHKSIPTLGQNLSYFFWGRGRHKIRNLFRRRGSTFLRACNRATSSSRTTAETVRWFDRIRTTEKKKPSVGKYTVLLQLKRSTRNKRINSGTSNLMPQTIHKH